MFFSPSLGFAQVAFEKSVYSLAQRADRCLSCHRTMTGREFASTKLTTACDIAKNFVDPVSPEKSALVIRAGNGHCSLDNCRGEATCFGDNFFGQLGDDSKMGRTAPTPPIDFGGSKIKFSQILKRAQIEVQFITRDPHQRVVTGSITRSVNDFDA